MKCVFLAAVALCAVGCGFSEFVAEDSQSAATPADSAEPAQPIVPSSAVPVVPSAAADSSSTSATDVESLITSRGGRLQHDQSDGSRFVIEVSLNDSGIGDQGAEYAAALPGLQRLWLKNSGITDAGLEHLSGVQSLVSLGVSRNPITDEGLAHLAALDRLERLDLSSTQVKGPGLVHLASLPDLTLLDLTQTGIDDSPLSALSALKNLRDLSLGGTGITKEAVQTLSNALPRCHIRSDSMEVKGLLGYWEVESAKIDGEVDEGLPGSFLIIRESGSFALVRKLQIGPQPSGKWDAVGDGRLTMEFSTGAKISANMRIDGDRLALTYQDAGAEFEVQYQRRDLKADPAEYNGRILIR